MPAYSDTDTSDDDRETPLTREGGIALESFSAEGGTATGRQAPAEGTVIRRGTTSRANTDLERRLPSDTHVESSGNTVWKWNILNVSLTAGAMIAVFGGSALLMSTYITKTQPIRINSEHLQPGNPPPYTVACRSSKPTQGSGITAEVTGTIDEENHLLTCCINTACDDTAEMTTYTVDPHDWVQGKVDTEGSLHRFAFYKVLDADRLRGKEVPLTAVLSQVPTSKEGTLPNAGATFATESTLHG